ncbi:MAG TPA: TIGR03943 family protein [Pseudonocardia sp.]|nr:TIGR03943 family protein [Pseudonocardia sp.]
MRRDTQNVVLVLLGGALIKISATDLYLRYVKPGNKWYLLSAGAVILLLAAVSLLRDAWQARAGARQGAGGAGASVQDHGHRAHGHRDHGHGAHGHLAHGHGEPHSPWLLMLPVLAIFLVAPPALGADSVQRASAGNSVTASSTADDFPPLPESGVPELRLSDFVARAVWDRSGSLAGRDVALTGFVVHRGGAAELARLVITCCAADARPMVVRLTDAPDLPSGTWLRLRARLLPGSATAADGYTPSVQVLDAEPIAEPAEAYEY